MWWIIKNEMIFLITYAKHCGCWLYRLYNMEAFALSIDTILHLIKHYYHNYAVLTLSFYPWSMTDAEIAVAFDIIFKCVCGWKSLSSCAFIWEPKCCRSASQLNADTKTIVMTLMRKLCVYEKMRRRRSHEQIIPKHSCMLSWMVCRQRCTLARRCSFTLSSRSAPSAKDILHTIKRYSDKVFA